MSISVHNIQVW